MVFSESKNRFLRLLKSFRSEVPAALFLLALPKCPACLMVILSAAGMQFIRTAVVRELFLLLLLGTLTRLIFAARRNRSWKPVLLAVPAVTTVLWGQIWSDHSLAAYIGIMGVAGAWFWTDSLSNRWLGTADCACITGMNSDHLQLKGEHHG